ncbi:hypothetical protein CBX98_25745, partial [Vibrio sp. T9]
AGDPVALAELVDSLAVELLGVGRRVGVGPHVRVAMGAGQIHGESLVVARIDARIAATVVVAAEGLRDLAAEGLRRVRGEVLDRAAEVAGRCGA